MFIAAAIVSSLVALALIASGRGKLVKDPAQIGTNSNVVPIFDHPRRRHTTWAS